MFLYFRYPFNWRTLYGYIFIIIYQSIITYLTASLIFNTMLMPVAHCIFTISFCFDLKNDIRMLNEIIKIESDNREAFSSDTIIKIKKKLCKIIRFHCKAKQLSGKKTYLYISQHTEYNHMLMIKCFSFFSIRSARKITGVYYAALSLIFFSTSLFCCLALLALQTVT